MLKVKRRSSANGGSGSTIIARIITTTSGAIRARIALTFGPSQAWSCWVKEFMRRRDQCAGEGRRFGAEKCGSSSAGTSSDGSAPGIGTWPFRAARSW